MPQGTAIHIDSGPVENFCRPAVDPMMRSLVSIYGSKILAVILTGMGSDGLKGCQELIKAGGQVIAQDEASSVVWGMPGAVANAGICSAVTPIPQLAEFVLKAVYKNQSTPL
jgi:two-component system chemotaxis response regulator CheB